MRHLETIDSPEAFGEALRQRRKAQHLTQTRAAALCGVSPRLWNQTETGKRPQLGFATALRMCQVLGLDLQLMPRSDPTGRGPNSR